MNFENKNQKGFILIGIIVVAIALASIGISYGIIYSRTSDIIKEAQKLSKEEKYAEAIELLEENQNKWVVKTLGIKKETIANEIEKNKILLEDKSEYLQGLEEIKRGNWEKAKELLSKVSEISPYYHDAKRNLEDIERRLLEKYAEYDAKRESDIRQVSTAQEMYFSDNEKYFTTSKQNGTPPIGSYLGPLHDPECPGGNCSPGAIDYQWLDNRFCDQEYCVYALLRNKGDCRNSRYIAASKKGVIEICDFPPTNGCNCW